MKRLTEDETQRIVDERKYLTGTGLLILIVNQFEFVHRSFAEYFFGRYLIEHINDERVQKLLLNKILLDNSYGLICQFFNGQVEKLLENNEYIKLTRAAIESITTNKGPGDETILSNTIQRGYHAIFSIFLKYST